MRLTKPAPLATTALLFVLSTFQSGAQNINTGVKPVDLVNPPQHLRKSALIELLSQRGLTAFPKMEESLVRQLIYADASPVRALIPRGRSAQRSSTDENASRRLIAPHSANKIPDRIALGFENYTAFPGNDYEGRLFLGFAPRTAKGEALSWNRQTRQFDFFVINEFGTGKAPQLLEVTHREDCTKCHQGGGPIWVVPPWSEVITHPPERLYSATPPQSFRTPPVLVKRGGTLLTREQTPRENNNGLAIDTASSVGNRLLQSTRIISELCRESLRCRKLLLAAALARTTPILTLHDGFQSSYLRKVVVKTGNTGNDATDLDFVVGPLRPLRNLLRPGLNNSSQIPDVLKPLQTFIDRNWAADGYAFIAQTLPDPTTFGSGPFTPRDLDPLTPRQPLGAIPKELALSYLFDTAFETFGFTYEDSLLIQSIPVPERLRPLELASDEISTHKLRKLVFEWPPVKEDILELYSDRLRTLSNLEDDPIAEAGSTTVAGVLFQKHCQTCHNNRASDIPIIPFPSPEALRKYNSENQLTVQDRLAQRSMPPRRISPRPTESEYQTMLRFFLGTQDSGTVSRRRGRVKTNHLGIRYQNVEGILNSYIVPDGVGIDSELSEKSRSESKSGGNELIWGRGTDGKRYLALENFPHYFLGNIVQAISLPAGTAGTRRRILAVSRNGGLYSLGFEPQHDSFASVPLTQGPGTQIALNHLSQEVNDYLFATGRDGAIYRMSYSGLPETTYNLTKITVVGYEATKWLKVGVTHRLGSIVAEALSVEGRRVSFLPQDETWTKWRPQASGETQRNSPLAPNLLDSTAVVLNPWGAKSMGDTNASK